MLNECGMSSGNLTQVGMKNIETMRLLMEGEACICVCIFFLPNLGSVLNHSGSLAVCLACLKTSRLADVLKNHLYGN